MKIWNIEAINWRFRTQSNRHEKKKEILHTKKKEKAQDNCQKQGGGGEEKITIESTWLNVFSSTGHVEYTALFSARVIHAN
jgi:hypothetical protein